MYIVSAIGSVVLLLYLQLPNIMAKYTSETFHNTTHKLKAVSTVLYYSTIHCVNKKRPPLSRFKTFKVSKHCTITNLTSSTSVCFQQNCQF